MQTLSILHTDTTHTHHFALFKIHRLGAAGIISRLLKIARIGRTVRIAKSMKSLKVLFSTLGQSLPYVATCFGLFMVLLYIYAVFGTSQFGSVKRGAYLHDRANFENFPNSLLTMFRVSTGDTWDALQYDLSIQPPLCSSKPDGTPGADCGSYIMSLLFFTSFNVFMGLIMMNVLVSVFLENFDEIEEQEGFIINQTQIDKFQQIWTELSPGHPHSGSRGSGLMLPVKLIPEFLRRLPKPIGLGPNASKVQVFKLLMHLHIPNPNCETGLSGERLLIETEVGAVSYTELLYALCWRKCGVDVHCNHRTKEVQKKLRKAMSQVEEVRLPPLACEHIYCMHHP